jgi:DNA repair exonuclease SbcCD nuclease subunit
MTLIAHLADLHLGYRQYNILEREGDFYEAFNEAVDLIIQEHVKIVLIAGDIFHSSRPPISALYCMKSNLEKLSSKGVKVYCVLGDHDLPRRLGEHPPTVLFEGEFLKHVSRGNIEVEVDGGSLVITGMDRIPPSLSRECSKELEGLSRQAQERFGKRILLTHVPSSDILSELTLNDLPENYHYYALGHEHVRRVNSKGLGVAAYPGSIEIMDYSEVAYWKKDGKGFYIVDLSGSEPNVQKVNLTSIRPQEIFEISLNEPLRKIEAEISAWLVSQHKKPVLHLLVKDPDYSLDYRKLQSLINNLYESGCLQVRCKRVVFRSDSDIRTSDRVELTRLNVEQLIRELSSKVLSTEEERELAIQIYKVFHKDGEETMKKFILEKAPNRVEEARSE